MAANLDKPKQWKADIAKSVDMYNDWFIEFAPRAFRMTRIQTTKDVEDAFHLTSNMTNLVPLVIKQHPEILPTLRMSTCPPLALDRLIGLAGVPANIVRSMELERKLPPRTSSEDIEHALVTITDIIKKMTDPDIFIWLDRNEPPTDVERYRAATIIADRLCGAVANPIIRNAQEKRQFAVIKAWLEERGYKQIPSGSDSTFDAMQAGTFSFRMNVPARLEGGSRSVNIPIDIVVMPRTIEISRFPVFIEAKSAGDYTNTNKRRKEEAMKMSLLRSTYGSEIQFNLFLCGYFDSGYLGYEAAEGIDWVWEHRVDELSLFGI